MGGGKRHTGAGPGDAAAGDNGLLLEDLEPDLAASVPVGGGLAGGNLGEVELHRAGVADVGVQGEADGVAGVDLAGLNALAGVALVAADRIAVDVLDRAVGLVVGRLADVLPLTGLKRCVSILLKLCVAKGRK